MVGLCDIAAYAKFKLMYLSLFKLPDKIFETCNSNNDTVDIDPDSDDEDDGENIVDKKIQISIEICYIVYKKEIINVTNKLKLLLKTNKTLAIRHIEEIILLENNPILYIKYKRDENYVYKCININEKKDLFLNKKLMFGQIIT